MSKIPSTPSTQRPPTTREIADEAGVSHVTVSKALRGDSKISAATTSRVVAIARKMGYRANPLLSAYMTAMRTRRSHPVTSALAWINGFNSAQIWHRLPYLKAYLDGARKRAFELGYNLDEFWLADPDLSDSRLSSILRARNIHGAIIPDAQDVTRHPSLDWERLTFCSFLNQQPGTLVRHVRFDARLAIYTALERIRALGFRRIGFAVSHLSPKPVSLLYEVCNTQIGLMPAKERVPLLLMDLGMEHFETRFQQWALKHRPEVVICNSLHAVDFLKSAGLSVPGDIGVVHLALGPDVAGWAGVDGAGEKIGAAAVEIVAAQINRNERGIPELPRTTFIAGEWQDGWTLTRPTNP